MMVQDYKTQYFFSKFPWARKRISPKIVDNLRTRPQKTFASPEPVQSPSIDILL
jgi:hypothetical protein